jgi:hypothetical protein
VVSEATATTIVNVSSGTTLALCEVLAIAARMRSVEQCWLLKAEWDGYSDGLCRTCTRYVPGPRALSGPPSSASSLFPYPYRVMGMVMMAFVEVATFDKSGTGATSILQAVIFSKPEAPVEERHTGSLLLLLRFLRSCAWCGCRCIWFSACGDDLQDPPAYRLPSPLK